MSSSGNEISKAASDPQEKDFVLDFLYHDPVRVGSFLSQFVPGGLLQSFKQSATVQSGKSSKTQTSASGGLPTVAKVGMIGEDQISDQESQLGERIYDPLWANALALLDYLEQRNLIAANAANASIGQFVKVQGDLTVTDMTLLKAIVEHPPIKKMFMKNAGPPAGKKGPEGGLTEGQMAIEIMPLVPHLIQATLTDSTNRYWAALNPERLSLPTGDLMLKHGPRVSGKWTMIGVLDAVPGDVDAEVGADISPFVQGIMTLASAMRPLIGRPTSAYGVTALLIYRAVEGG